MASVPDRIVQPTPEFTEAEIEEWFESEEAPPQKPRARDEDIVQRYTDAQLQIVRSTMDLSLHNLRQSLKDSTYINLNPSYQRRHRWDIRKRSQLIESLLLNIPIPPIFLYENDYNQYEIMDGRQRLESIKSYLENDFPLRSLEYWPELDGYRFLDLPSTIQRGLLRRTISAIVLLAETSRPEESSLDVRMALFKRLNTGGVKLNPQELRNSLYQSAFNEMILRLSRWDTFRDTWGIPRYTEDEDDVVPKNLANNALYKTMADCELVLRFYAIKETILHDRKGSLQRLLDTTMKGHFSDTETVIVALETEFRAVLQFLFDAFESRPFVLPQTNRPSRPAYDALMVAAALTGLDPLRGREAEIRLGFNEAARDRGKYDILVGRANSVEAIRERVELAREILTV